MKHLYLCTVVLVVWGCSDELQTKDGRGILGDSEMEFGWDSEDANLASEISSVNDSEDSNQEDVDFSETPLEALLLADIPVTTKTTEIDSSNGVEQTEVAEEKESVQAVDGGDHPRRWALVDEAFFSAVDDGQVDLFYCEQEAYEFNGCERGARRMSRKAERLKRKCIRKAKVENRLAHIDQQARVVEIQRRLDEEIEPESKKALRVAARLEAKKVRIAYRLSHRIEIIQTRFDRVLERRLALYDRLVAKGCTVFEDDEPEPEEPTYYGFMHYCENYDWVTADQQHTVDRLLYYVRGFLTDCAAAENKLMALDTLYLEGVQIVDVNPLSSLTNLSAIYIYSNQIEDIAPLGELTNLTFLYLANNKVSDIGPLASLTNLTFLALFLNELVDLEPLSHLTEMRELVLANNLIEDVSPLSELVNLTSLALYDNPLGTTIQKTEENCPTGLDIPYPLRLFCVQ